MKEVAKREKTKETTKIENNFERKKESQQKYRTTTLPLE